MYVPNTVDYIIPDLGDVRVIDLLVLQSFPRLSIRLSITDYDKTRYTVHYSLMYKNVMELCIPKCCMNNIAVAVLVLVVSAPPPMNWLMIA